MKKVIITLLKAGVSIAIIVYLFRTIDFAEVWQLFKNVHVEYLIFALCLYLAGQVLCVYRWKLVASLMGFHNSFREFFIYYFIGMFFNLFLPTAIGGDVGKCIYLARGNKKVLRAAVSVLADRGAGLIVMVAIAGVSLMLINGISLPSSLPAGILVGNVAMVVGLFTPLFAGKLLSRLGEKVNLLLTYWKQPAPLIKAIGISVIFHALIIIIHILIGMSLDMSIPWKFYLLVVPLVVLVSMIPVSLSGIGLREGAYVFFLAFVNVPRTEALTFAFGWFTILIISSLAGGIVFAIHSFVSKK
ncbi:MAG: flippase-like domain-containing protein [Nitrospirae bacterium]|nr:flippase-like domain-containing protein [Nitrospirota bacterium]